MRGCNFLARALLRCCRYHFTFSKTVLYTICKELKWQNEGKKWMTRNISGAIKSLTRANTKLSKDNKMNFPYTNIWYFNGFPCIKPRHKSGVTKIYEEKVNIKIVSKALWYCHRGTGELTLRLMVSAIFTRP